VGSLAIMIASSAFIVPYERMRQQHPLRNDGRDIDLSEALKSLDKRELFSAARFWDGAPPGNWRFSRKVGGVLCGAACLSNR
jgi:hypothetical protein